MTPGAFLLVAVLATSALAAWLGPARRRLARLLEDPSPAEVEDEARYARELCGPDETAG